MSKIKELQERRARAHAHAVSLLAKGTLTAEDNASIDKAFNEVDQLGKDIQRYERAEQGISPYSVRDYDNPWTDSRQIELAKAFGIYLRRGLDGMNPEQRKVLTEQRAVGEGDLKAHIGTYTGLGYFVPTGFTYDVEVAQKWFAPLLDGSVCEVIETATGNPLPYPISNDTSVEAEIVGESAPVAEGDITAGHVVLGAYKFSSKLVKVSLELVQDSAFNLEAFLAKRFGERFGRAYENKFTLGSGTAEPTGLLTAIAASGAVPVTAAGSAETSGGSETGTNSIGWGDLVRLEHSVDPAYRRGAKYMFRDSTLSQLKRILDKFGRPLWLPGIKEGAPDTINGYPYVINQRVPAIAGSASTVIFGDFKKFLIRKVAGMTVLRLTERYADVGQVAFLAFQRVDSRELDAGTHPLNVLQQAS